MDAGIRLILEGKDTWAWPQSWREARAVLNKPDPDTLLSSQWRRYNVGRNVVQTALSWIAVAS